MLKRNTIANYLGTGWAALMAIAFVPLYIGYLGIEAFGIIGLFVLLQAWLTLLDLGMTPTLNREMARFTAGLHSPEAIRDILRTLEAVAALLAILVAATVVLAAPWIATRWVQVGALSADTAARAIAMMGVVIGLRFLESLFRGSILGLQRQVLYNAIHATTATLHGAGAVAVLAFWSPTLEAFFLWHMLVSALSVGLLAVATYLSLPQSVRVARVSTAALRGIWRFAGGMLGITLLSLLLTQVDKLLLSTLLPLAEYGVYVLAAAVAAVPVSLTAAPITQAWFPRMSQLHASGNEAALAQTFHQGAQLASMTLGTAAIFLIFFSEPLLRIWTGDADLARQAAPLLSLLAFGNLLNGLMWLPYHAQLAHGWTSLTIHINTCAVLVIVPAILIVTPIYGAIGAASIWVALNAFYVLVGAPLMFRRILRGEQRRWYLEDLLRPLALAGFAGLAMRILLPTDLSGASGLVLLLLAAGAVLAAATLATPWVTTRLYTCLRANSAFV